MECSFLGWLNFSALVVTALIIAYYTRETHKLRVEAQRQTELQIRPFLSLVYDQATRGLLLYNFGQGVARNIRVHDVRLSPAGMPHPIIVEWEATDFIAPGRQRPLSGNATQDGVSSQDSQEPWRSNFGPHGHQELEVVIDYDDLAENGYRARFKVLRGVVTLVEDRRRKGN
jgi:hypothetical protein